MQNIIKISILETINVINLLDKIFLNLLAPIQRKFWQKCGQKYVINCINLPISVEI